MLSFGEHCLKYTEEICVFFLGIPISPQLSQKCFNKQNETKQANKKYLVGGRGIWSKHNETLKELIEIFF